MARTTKHTLADAAHVAGLTSKELTKRASTSRTKSPARRSASAGPARPEKEGLQKTKEGTLSGTGRSTTLSGRGTKTVKKETEPSLEETIPHAQVPHLKAFLA